MVTALAANLWAGCRLVLAAPVDRGAFRLGADQAALLLVLGALLDGAVEFFETEPVATFNIYALPDTGFYALLLIASAYGVTRVLTRAPVVSDFVVLIAATYPVMLATRIAMDWVIREGYLSGPPWLGPGIVGLFIGWLVMVAFRSVRVLYGASPWRALVLGVLFAACNTVPAFVFPDQSLWFSESTDQEAPDAYANIDAEAAFYRQPTLLEQALQSVEPGRPGVPDLYFVGFASYAHADVFMKELSWVKALFEERFDTRNRSLALVNNVATLERLPMASVSNLRLVLARLAGLMDRDEDVLFLFLTSHGSKDHELAVDFWPISLNGLRGPALKTMLDEAGIRWRVVVVSACYSGGFVESLKDENTLVIAAARADRPSFGCAHENDFTYFGAAYFAEQLSQTRSFVDGFDRALVVIEQRERERDLMPSLPQIHLGRDIKGPLETLRQRLEAAGTGAGGNKG